MAKTLHEIEQQMNSVGIFLPPGKELTVNGENWQRFKPQNSRFKRDKDAWYAIWERNLSSGKTYYFGVFGVGAESYKIEHKNMHLRIPSALLDSIHPALVTKPITPLSLMRSEAQR